MRKVKKNNLYPLEGGRNSALYYFSSPTNDEVMEKCQLVVRDRDSLIP